SGVQAEGTYQGAQLSRRREENMPELAARRTVKGKPVLPGRAATAVSGAAWHPPRRVVKTVTRPLLAAGYRACDSSGYRKCITANGNRKFGERRSGGPLRYCAGSSKAAAMPAGGIAFNVAA